MMKSSLLERTLVAALLVSSPIFLASGCGSSDPGEQVSTSQVEMDNQEITREEAAAIVADALAQDFDTVRYEMVTRTTAAATVEGRPATQEVKTSMKGELSKAEGDPWAHLSYEAQSSDRRANTKQEIYVADDYSFIVQDDEMYESPIAAGEASAYVQSLMQITTQEEFEKLLDVALECELETGVEGEKVVSITADVNRLDELELVDTSSLPKGSTVSSLVVRYGFDEENRFKSVRITSNTNGSPTYWVHQTYKFSDYNEVEKPEWPDYEAYILERSGLLRDEDGRFYIVADDGSVYYFESIDEDGIIHFSS